MACSLSELNQRVGVQDRVKYFEECQGGRAAAVIWNGWMIWETGTARELAGGGQGLMRDATWVDKNDLQEVKKTLWFRIRYYQTRFSDAIKEFEAAKAELTKRAQYSSVHGSQAPDKDEYKQVRRLRHKVKGFEKKLTDLFLILNPEPEPVTYTKEQMEVMEKNRNQSDKILSELKTLEV